MICKSIDWYLHMMRIILKAIEPGIIFHLLPEVHQNVPHTKKLLQLKAAGFFNHVAFQWTVATKQLTHLILKFQS